VVVPATDNIFGAGHDSPPDPGGGGGGDSPAEWSLESGTGDVVSFPVVTGEVTPRAGTDDYVGPGGDTTRGTDVESYGGISGIVDGDTGMFLVGVFLTDEEPADPAPDRLDFTGIEDFEEVKPEIGQTFFIGDGVGHRYVVPAGATRLFLGFVDAYSGVYYHGQPGYYDNNAGELAVKVEVSSG
jgi:hypothetical protein